MVSSNLQNLLFGTTRLRDGSKKGKKLRLSSPEDVKLVVNETSLDDQTEAIPEFSYPSSPSGVADSESEGGDGIQYFSESKSTAAKEGAFKKSKVKPGLPSPRVIELERMAELRRRNQIFVWGSDPPKPMENFEEMNLNGKLLDNILERKAFGNPTPVQMQCIPAMMSARNVLVSAPTGSGKTLGFSAPIISMLSSQGRHKHVLSPRALIIQPTRELAVQTLNEMKIFCEEVPDIKVNLLRVLKPKIHFKARFDVLICTPKTLISAIKGKESERKTSEKLKDKKKVNNKNPAKNNEKESPEPPLKLSLKLLEWLVVDESDKLFETGAGKGTNGFREQLAEIYIAATKQHESRRNDNEGIAKPTENNSKSADSKKSKKKSNQKSKAKKSDLKSSQQQRPSAELKTAFFSATFSYEVEQWCKLNVDNLLMTCIGRRNSGADSVKQELIYAGSESGKLVAIRQEILKHTLEVPILIFVQSIDRAEQLELELARLIPKDRVRAIHGKMHDKVRNSVVDGFRSGRIWYLICTDLMGRGMDFAEVNCVINWDLPASPIAYIHRIGRTGRGGRSGRSITFFTEGDKPLVRSIANVASASKDSVFPAYVQDLRKPKRKLKRKYEHKAPKREKISNNELFAGGGGKGKRKSRKRKLEVE